MGVRGCVSRVWPGERGAVRGAGGGLIWKHTHIRDRRNKDRWRASGRATQAGAPRVGSEREAPHRVDAALDPRREDAPAQLWIHHSQNFAEAQQDAGLDAGGDERRLERGDA